MWWDPAELSVEERGWNSEADIYRYLLLIRLCCIKSGEFQPPESTLCFVFSVITNTTTPTRHTQLVQSQNVFHPSVDRRKRCHDWLERHRLYAAGMTDGMNRPGGDRASNQWGTRHSVWGLHQMLSNSVASDQNLWPWGRPQSLPRSRNSWTISGAYRKRGAYIKSHVSFGFWLTVCWTSFLVQPEGHRVQIQPGSTVILNVRVCVAAEVWLWQKLTGLARVVIARCSHAN